MKTLEIKTGNNYKILIGTNIINHCGENLLNILGLCKVAVITDNIVAGLYLDTVIHSLKAAGFETVSFIFPHGETSKNISVLSDILEFFAVSGLTRKDCAVALGGGVVGDITGFAAGCYMRGIRYIQLPTTLLAAVDSSVGGKTAVNLRSGKNLAGLFLQPASVLCDTGILSTLPGNIFSDGIAEIIKVSILSNERLFAILERNDIHEYLDDIIYYCVSYKGTLVEQDEYEHGIRKLLNLGHTVGHAIEKCSNYSISHGRAVATGIAVTARASDKYKISESNIADRIISVLRRNNLPTETEYSAKELALAALSDKKRIGDIITLVLPIRIGKCCLQEFPVDELEKFIGAGIKHEYRNKTL